MPATARVPSSTSTLRDGLSTGTRRHPRVPLDTRHSARSQGGEGPRTAHQAAPEGTPGDTALCPGPSCHQETRDSCGPHAGSAAAACQGWRKRKVGNVPTSLGVTPHGVRDPGTKPTETTANGTTRATECAQHRKDPPKRCWPLARLPPGRRRQPWRPKAPQPRCRRRQGHEGPLVNEWLMNG